MSKDNELIYTNLSPHGCRDCGEINKDYTGALTGRKICAECGGLVLNLQEAFDYIMQLRAEVDGAEWSQEQN